jgi:hypothetical protein
MLMSNPTRFPLLAFTEDDDLWSFHDNDELTTCGPLTLQDGMQQGMIVVDPAGNCWRVRSVERVGAAPFSWRLIFQPRMARIRHEWEPQRPVSLQEVQERVCACVAAHPDYWFELDDTEALAQRQAEVRRAPSIEAIHSLFGLDNFRGY